MVDGNDVRSLRSFSCFPSRYFVRKASAPYFMDTPALTIILVILGELGSEAVSSIGLIAKNRISNENASPGLTTHRAPPP